MSDFRNLKVQSKNERKKFYNKTLNYLLDWHEKNKELSSKILNYLNSNTEQLCKEDIKTFLNFYIENSKILYATVALLDKMIRVKQKGETDEKN